MSVERIILFKLHRPETRSELAALTLATLSDIDELDELSVGLPADDASEKSWDLSLVLRAANVSLLRSLLEREPLRGFLEQTMAERSVVIKAWSFERQS